MKLPPDVRGGLGTLVAKATPYEYAALKWLVAEGARRRGNQAATIRDLTEALRRSELELAEERRLNAALGEARTREV